MYQVIVKRIEEKNVRENTYQRTAESGNPKGDGPIYGYVANTQRRVIETEIYRQTVEELDLSDVVCVVNGVGRGE